jgi:hypothetical protein
MTPGIIIRTVVKSDTLSPGGGMAPTINRGPLAAPGARFTYEDCNWVATEPSIDLMRDDRCQRVVARRLDAGRPVGKPLALCIRPHEYKPLFRSNVSVVEREEAREQQRVQRDQLALPAQKAPVIPERTPSQRPGILHVSSWTDEPGLRDLRLRFRDPTPSQAPGTDRANGNADDFSRWGKPA